MSDFIVPEVGEVVRYTNAHGFPRAAIVTGTITSLEGEQHVSLIRRDSDLHLTVFSPIRNYLEFHVAYSPDGEPGTWQYQPGSAPAEAWAAGSEATAEWMANNPSPAGIPQDPPRNPYEPVS